MFNKKRFFMLTGILMLFALLAECSNSTKVTLTLDANGGQFSNGTSIHVIEIESSKSILLPENPTKKGFVFEGWYLDKDVWEELFEDSSLIKNLTNENITVYSKWGNETISIEKFVITFDTNGGSVLPNLTIEKNTTITIPNEPKKDNFIFDGWFTDINLTESADTVFINGLTSDITLFAKWLPNKEDKSFTITFDSLGGSILLPITVDKNTAITKPNSPEMKDYIFKGWYLNELLNDSADDLFINGISENTTIYAKWEKIEVEIITEGLQFTLKENNTYELTGYTGTDLEVYLPSTYNEKQITSIGYVQTSTNFTKIHLSKYISKIDDGIFTSPQIEAVTVSPDNSLYKDIEGVLYNKDLTVLVWYPAAKSTSYEVPNGTLEIGESAFRYNTKLNSITFPNTLNKIGSKAFWDNSSLLNVTLPNSVTHIGWNAFYNSGLTSVTLSDNLVVIERSAFAGSDLIEIVIPNSVTTIGVDAFAACNSLIRVTMLSNTPPTIDVGVFRTISSKYNANLVIYVPNNYVNVYKDTVNWETYKDIITNIS